MAWASSSTYPSLLTFPGFDPGSFTGGPADSHQLIVTLDGVEHDLGADITGTVTVEQQQRSTETEDPQPATLAVTLRNFKGAYTPDNPGSPYWPHLGLQTPITYRVTKNGNTVPLFTGTIDGLTPAFHRSSKDGTVSITASDRLGAAARQTLRSDINERWVAAAAAASKTSDVWMFGEADGASVWANTGRGGLGLAAQRIKPKSGRGQVARDEADGLIVEGALTITDSNGVAPTVLAKHARGQLAMMVWFKFTGPPPYLPDYNVLLAGRKGRVDGDLDGDFLWHLRFQESAPGTGIFELQLRAGSGGGALVGVLDTGQGDGAWHSLSVWNQAAGVTTFRYDTGDPLSAGIDLADQEYVVLGGSMNPYVKGNQAHCMTASFAALMVTTGVTHDLEAYVQAGSTMPASQRWTDLMSWRTYVGAYAMVGTDTRQVAVKSSLGRPQLDTLNELALTVGGTIWHNPSNDAVELLTGPVWRPQAVAAVVVLELDDDIAAGHEWGLTLADSPTRMTATCPDGEGTYIATAAEATGVRDGGTIETCAATVADARSLAAWQVSRIRRLSLSSFAVDVAGAVNSAALWPAVLGLFPGARLRITNIDQAVFGITHLDVHAMAWKAEIGPETALWTFSTLPADSPAEYAVADPEYGRLGWNPGEATASALTSTETSLTITTTYPLTNDTGEYPLQLLIDGEVLTVPAPPTSTTSPQTLTVVRAADGTVATAHPAGRSVYMHPDVRVGP